MHRLNNALDAISPDEYVKRSIMRMISSWGHGTSYEIPIGPHASNILAEGLLIEVDEFLLSKDVNFLRHDDDYIIFGDANECLLGLFLLGERLQQTQRLSLNADKTRVMAADYYLSHHHPSGQDTGTRQRIVNDILDGNPYADIEYDDLTETEKKAISEIDPGLVLETELERDIINLPTIEVVLRVLRAKPELYHLHTILANLNRLRAVARDVAKFLISAKSLNTNTAAESGDSILSFLLSEAFVSEYQAIWLLEPFTKSSDWNNLQDLRRISNDHEFGFVRRQAILGLGEIGDRSSLLDYKSRIGSTREWERRAIIYALRKLPEDEFEATLSFLGGAGGQWTRRNALEKSVMKYAKDI